jgi:hypothetical protein
MIIFMFYLNERILSHGNGSRADVSQVAERRPIEKRPNFVPNGLMKIGWTKRVEGSW